MASWIKYNKMVRKSLLAMVFIAWVVTISGCDDEICGNEVWHVKHLTGNIYYYKWGDKPSGRAITDGKCVCGVDVGGLIIGGIFAVGYDDDFVIVKSHPSLSQEIINNLTGDKNPRGDYSILDLKDTVYLIKKKDSTLPPDNSEGKDSIYEEGDKWYHKNKQFEDVPSDLKGEVNLQTTFYYIYKIRKDYNGFDTNPNRLHIYKTMDDYLNARKSLGINEKLGFTIIDKQIE